MYKGLPWENNEEKFIKKSDSETPKFEKVIGKYYSPFKIKLLLEDIDELIEKKNLQFVEHNVEEIVEKANAFEKGLNLYNRKN